MEKNCPLKRNKLSVKPAFNLINRNLAGAGKRSAGVKEPDRCLCQLFDHASKGGEERASP
jgi:hypothetical protein